MKKQNSKSNGPVNGPVQSESEPEIQPETPALPDFESTWGFCYQQKKLRLALTTAEANVSAAEFVLMEKRKALAESASKSIISSSVIGDDSEPIGELAETDEYLTATLEWEKSKAALSGVKKRIADSDVELLATLEKLKADREIYNSQVIDQWFRGSEEIVETFKHVMRCGFALEASLGVVIPELHRVMDPGPYSDDIGAQHLNEEYSEPKRLQDALDEYKNEADDRARLEETRRLTRAGFDPVAKYIVRLPCRVNGKEFPIGATVDASNFGLALLSNLYEARRLNMIDPKDEWSA